MQVRLNDERENGSASHRAPIATIPGVCEVRRVGAATTSPPAAPRLLIEVPHGATRTTDFEAIRGRLVSTLPADLVEFFYVNTDVGSYECALELARRIVEPQAASPRGDGGRTGVIVLKSSIPRTFIDCNRLIRGSRTGSESRMTPAIADYIEAEEDRRWLESLHASYQNVARRSYELVCGSGGIALQLHTYAPRSIEIGRIDGSIVESLRSAYEPQRYARWPRRPDVDIISRTDDDRGLAPPGLVNAIKVAYAAIGVRAAENATYRLHPETMGYRFAESFPGRVVCVELNRELLADPFSPFEEMRVARDSVARMTGPLATALVAELAGRRASDSA